MGEKQHPLSRPSKNSPEIREFVDVSHSTIVITAWWCLNHPEIDQKNTHTHTVPCCNDVKMNEALQKVTERGTNGTNGTSRSAWWPRRGVCFN